MSSVVVLCNVDYISLTMRQVGYCSLFLSLTMACWLMLAVALALNRATTKYCKHISQNEKAIFQLLKFATNRQSSGSAEGGSNSHN